MRLCLIGKSLYSSSSPSSHSISSGSVPVALPTLLNGCLLLGKGNSASIQADLRLTLRGCSLQDLISQVKSLVKVVVDVFPALAEYSDERELFEEIQGLESMQVLGMLPLCVLFQETSERHLLFELTRLLVSTRLGSDIFLFHNPKKEGMLLRPIEAEVLK